MMSDMYSVGVHLFSVLYVDFCTITAIMTKVILVPSMNKNISKIKKLLITACSFSMTFASYLATF